MKRKRKKEKGRRRKRKKGQRKNILEYISILFIIIPPPLLPLHHHPSAPPFQGHGLCPRESRVLALPSPARTRTVACLTLHDLGRARTPFACLCAPNVTVGHPQRLFSLVVQCAAAVAAILVVALNQASGYHTGLGKTGQDKTITNTVQYNNNLRSLLSAFAHNSLPRLYPLEELLRPRRG